MNTPSTTTVTYDRAEFGRRINATGHVLSPDHVAQTLMDQFIRHASPELITYLAGQRGNPGNVWTHIETLTRAKVRAELVDELELAKLVSKVAAKRHD